MKCISCESWSWHIICKRCQKDFFKPTFHTRKLQNDFLVHSFYPYDEIKNIINTKYKFYGDRVFNILASLSFGHFSQNFQLDDNIFVIPIDDHTRRQFSQSAILAKHLKSKSIKPIYSTLRALNTIKYAGKDLEFRQKHKRNFRYTGKNNIKVILVDDLITTGLTILEAKEKLQSCGCDVLFALTLSDAKL